MSEPVRQLGLPRGDVNTLPGDRVRLFRTRGFDGKVTTRVWTVPGLPPEGLVDDLAALTAAIEELRHLCREER